MSTPVVIPSFGGDATVGTVATTYPFTPGIDTVLQTAEQTGALAAGSGLHAGGIVQVGTFSVTGTATGTATEAITFATAFPTSCSAVMVSLTGLGAAVINGGAYATSPSATGVTVNVDITTAGTGDVTGNYVAYGY